MKFEENQQVRAKEEKRIFKGLGYTVIRPEDILRVIGYDRLGMVCCRFDNCADLPALHDALLGRFYFFENELEAI